MDSRTKHNILVNPPVQSPHAAAGGVTAGGGTRSTSPPSPRTDTQLKVQGKEAKIASRPESNPKLQLTEQVSVKIFMNNDIENTMNRTRERLSRDKVSSHTVD
mmetsp:Transcript_20625/g.27843  ORF Transcript_20625/g.27843 Transcript_20625/m.27843 type:complete len:103 (-) Transcript_20625:581-889(-)|eukprot:CAMPEP_0185569828 /NCGR_PEP_ID=MMETSP0434-20130131/2339_1 /TAXON_ID=626734 ORGANISM="Favella taraikaensis, Strain Fe Narragansett Bay" /NCGR_SAMPLE_ID=MMETSP0434 /ASSEMBLY_ACC=CAM_ASM_000379 /LENGTH=102 /DNA_ID=CAMNT_0028184763 /DNA_START=1277 /DNA_END=1585 /DNA_ORIENTATION=-